MGGSPAADRSRQNRPLPVLLANGQRLRAAPDTPYHSASAATAHPIVSTSSAPSVRAMARSGPTAMVARPHPDRVGDGRLADMGAQVAPERLGKGAAGTSLKRTKLRLADRRDACEAGLPIDRHGRAPAAARDGCVLAGTPQVGSPRASRKIRRSRSRVRVVIPTLEPGAPGLCPIAVTP